VYEGLLEYEPVILPDGAQTTFAFKQGDERANTGSHYTPDELVQPLIKHSLDHLIAERLKAKDPEGALLSLRVADVACGSGHILLAAARRIGRELAVVRTGEDQPSPLAMRTAVRDVIRHCIYGVDLNPLAVELCKVALWLEAHVPGEPLSFLDHHIKCGNAIVGYVRREDIEARGIPDEAFVTMPGDDKEVAALLRQRNKAERSGQKALKFDPQVERQLDEALKGWKGLDKLPEHTPEQVEAKRLRFEVLSQSAEALWMEQLAAIPIAQFYIPKVKNQPGMHVTEEEFRSYWKGERKAQSRATAEAWAVAARKRFFQWFLAFPEVMSSGGFDCILGNPPYLGGQALSSTYGHQFGHFVRWEYAPTGLSDVVVYFVRRIYGLLRPGGFMSFLTTNSIKDGDVRKDGIAQVISTGGEISFAARNIKWPGRANLTISMLTVHKGPWSGDKILDGRTVAVISPFLDDSDDEGAPARIGKNLGRMYQGSIFRGDGFLISEDEALSLKRQDNRYSEVIRRIINGQEVNNEPDQAPQRLSIDFYNWSLERASQYPAALRILEERVKPVREELDPSTAINRDHRARWWQYAFVRESLYECARKLKMCSVVVAHTKYLSFSLLPSEYIFTHAMFVLADDRWDLLAALQSSIHETWARKYSGSLETRLRYSPTDCFETFPLPGALWDCSDAALAGLGEHYHEHRRGLMRELWLGLTDIYNLFHARDLSPELVAKVSKKPADVARAGFDGLLELRRLHVALDNAVRDAYGWTDLNLGHDFVEVETLPENDRVRYTISPAARKELLKRLLALNHQRAKEEATKAPAAKAKGNKKSTSKADPNQPDLI
jgi:hypothetical protein